MSDPMSEVGTVLHGPLTPDPDHPMVQLFNEMEEGARQIFQNDPALLAQLHQGFNVLRLGSHFEFGQAYVPEGVKEAMHSVVDFYATQQVTGTRDELVQGKLDLNDLRHRFLLVAGIGTIMGYVTRALEVDGRWPRS